MARKWKRIGCLYLLWMLFFLCGCAGKGQETEKEGSTEHPGLTVTFFDVGKGDAILIETEGGRMLIDSGYEKTSRKILDYLEEHQIRSLDYLVITHFDKDHVGGADWVLRTVDVGEILQPDYQSDGGQYQEYLEALEEEEKEPVPVKETRRLELGEAQILIYPPQQEAYEEEDNDFSLVISMAYGERRFLFAGDSERVRLEELLNQGEFHLSHHVLKVPHHGRKEKNSKEFLKAVSPEIAILTCSKEEPADEKVLDILSGMGADIYQTADGTIVCRSDGKSLEIETE